MENTNWNELSNAELLSKFEELLNDEAEGWGEWQKFAAEHVDEVRQELLNRMK